MVVLLHCYLLLYTWTRRMRPNSIADKIEWKYTQQRWTLCTRASILDIKFYVMTGRKVTAPRNRCSLVVRWGQEVGACPTFKSLMRWREETHTFILWLYIHIECVRICFYLIPDRYDASKLSQLTPSSYICNILNKGRFINWSCLFMPTRYISDAIPDK